MRIDNPSVSGSISFITGTNQIQSSSAVLSGSFSGSFQGDGSGMSGISADTSTTASYIEYGNVANKPALVSGSDQVVSLIENQDITLGNLTVNGTQTIIDSTTVDIGDNIIQLNTGGAVNGGLLIKDVTAPNTVSGSLLWDTTNDYWIAGQLGSESKVLLQSGDNVAFNNIDNNFVPQRFNDAIYIGSSPQLIIEKFGGNFRILQSGTGYGGTELQLARAGETTRVMGDLIVDEDATISGQLTVTDTNQAVLLSGNRAYLDMNDGITRTYIRNDSTNGYALYVNTGGEHRFNDYVRLEDNLQVDGTSTFNSNATINGVLTVDTSTNRMLRLDGDFTGGFTTTSIYRQGVEQWREGVSSDNSYVIISDGTGSIGTVLSIAQNGNTTINGSLTVDTNTLFVDSTNNRVGIGTSSPSKKLEISEAAGQGTTPPTLRITNTSSYGDTGTLNVPHGAIEFYQEETSGNYPAVSAAIKVLNTNIYGVAHALAFYTNNNSSTPTERMRIDSSGNVGIGSAPLGILSTASDDFGLVFKSTSSSNRRMQLFFKDNANSDTGKIAIDVDGTNTNTMSFFTGATERMRIDSSGNVGIGTTSPTSGYKLDVEGGGIRAVGPNATGTFLDVRNDGASGALFRRANASSYPYNLYNFYNGRVGIGGITPVYPLHIEAESGGPQIYLSRVNAYARVYMGGTDSTASELYIDAGGAGGVRLDYNATSWVSASDIRLKNVSSEITGTLAKLKNIRGVNFSWKNDEDNKNNYGVIAQEVEDQFPELVSESSLDGMKGVRYTEFVPILISAIKELKAEIDLLKSQNH